MSADFFTLCPSLSLVLISLMNHEYSANGQQDLTLHNMCSYDILSKPCASSRKEVVVLKTLFTFLLSIMASIVAYYICKWLDRE